MFENKNRLENNFHSKDPISEDLTARVVYKLQYGLCNESHYGECVIRLNVRTIEHILQSLLTKK